MTKLTKAQEKALIAMGNEILQDDNLHGFDTVFIANNSFSKVKLTTKTGDVLVKKGYLVYYYQFANSFQLSEAGKQYILNM